MSWTQGARALTLAAACFFSQIAAATTVNEYLALNGKTQVDLYDKIVLTRLGQLRSHNPNMADTIETYYLKAAQKGGIPAGFDDFRSSLYAIKHPELTHLDQKGYDADKTQVEDLLTKLMVQKVQELSAAQHGK